MSKPDRQVEHHAHNGCRNAGKGSLEPLVAGHGFDKWRSGKNEKKARQKRHISGDKGTDERCRQRIEATGQVPLPAL